MTNLLLRSNIAGNEMEGLVKCEVQVNYNNIDKVEITNHGLSFIGLLVH